MAITLGALNLNTGAYRVLNKGVNLGNTQTTFDETPNYSGAANAQTNVQRGHLIKMSIPMMVTGTSVSNLLSNLSALWAEVDKATNTLTWDSESFAIVYSSRPETIERDEFFQLGFIARFTLELMREPS